MNNSVFLQKMFQSAASKLFFALLLIPIAFAMVFFFTLDSNPHSAELAFVEHSTDKDIIGSVVPASCESAPPTNHFAGDCAVPPTPSTITVACGVPTNPPGPKTISWPASARATYYMVRLDYVGDPAPHLVQNDNYGATSFTFTPALDTNYVTWVHACNVSGCSLHQAVNFNCPSPVVVGITASPSKVDAGDSTTINWNVTGATSCTASGGWSGARTPGVGSENFNPTANTTYTLTCTGPGGTVSNSATVLVPSGYITGTNCTIPFGASSCDVNVIWESYNFFTTSQVSQGTTTFSTAASSAGTVRSIAPGNSTFTLEDAGGDFSTTFVSTVNCALGSVWAGNRCVELPSVDISADPNVIRSGATAPLEIEIVAAYELTCTVNDGGAPQVFTHSGTPSSNTYNRTTRTLTSAQIVSVNCVSPLYPVVNGNSDVRINVVPTIQET